MRLFSSGVRLVIMVDFVRECVPYPFISAKNEGNFYGKGIDVAAFNGAIASCITIPSLMITPYGAFAPRFRFTVIRGFVPGDFTALITDMFEVASKDNVRFCRYNADDDLIVRRVVDLYLCRCRFQ